MLTPTYFIDADNPDILKTAQDLTEGFTDVKDKAVQLFLFARDAITYNPYGPILKKERYRASNTLKRGYGYCIQKATLFAALLRATGIPASLIFADIKNPLIPRTLRDTMKTDTFIFHCYNNIHINGKWLKATCAFDTGTCQKLGVPPVEFDGNKDAIFPSILPDGKPFVTYLRHRGEYSDIPFLDIIKEFKSFYGHDVIENVSIIKNQTPLEI